MLTSEVKQQVTKHELGLLVKVGACKQYILQKKQIGSQMARSQECQFTGWGLPSSEEAILRWGKPLALLH